MVTNTFLLRCVLRVYRCARAAIRIRDAVVVVVVAAVVAVVDLAGQHEFSLLALQAFYLIANAVVEEAHENNLDHNMLCFAAVVKLRASRRKPPSASDGLVCRS